MQARGAPPKSGGYLIRTYAFFTVFGLDFPMHLMQANGDLPPDTPVHPGNFALRRAIRGNIVSFPSQVPALLKQPAADTQWRVVLLFFIRGWSSAEIARRFDVPRHRISEMLNDWSIRALALGYLQVIDAEAFRSCCRVDSEIWTKGDVTEVQRAEVVREPFPREARDAAPGAGQPPVERFVDRSGEIAAFIAALDAPIARCEECRGEFWDRAATILRDLRVLATFALESRPSGETRDLPFTTLMREEEHPSHAVA